MKRLGRCELCERDECRLYRHHLVPQSRKHHEEEEYGTLAKLCRDCHRKIHATWDNKTIARQLPTIDKLRAAPELQSYLAWIRKRPGTTYFGSADTKA